jgi:hypothetical protein
MSFPLHSKTFILGFLIGIVQTKYSSAGTFAGQRCQLNREGVVRAAQSISNSLRRSGKRFPEVTPIAGMNGKIDGAPGSFEKNLYFEGFIHPEADYVRAVPGLGLGMEVSEHTLVYVCVDINTRGEKSGMKMIFLDHKGLRKNGVLSGSNDIELGKSNIQVRPLGEGFGLIEKIPGIGIFGKLLRKSSDAVTDKLFDITNAFIGVGVGEIEITEDSLNLKSGTKLLGVPVHQKSRSFPYDGHWMKSIPAPPVESLPPDDAVMPGSRPAHGASDPFPEDESLMPEPTSEGSSF